MHIYARDNSLGMYFELIFEIQIMNSNKINFTRKNPHFRMQQLHCNFCINDFCRDFWLNQSIKNASWIIQEKIGCMSDNFEMPDKTTLISGDVVIDLVMSMYDLEGQRLKVR